MKAEINLSYLLALGVLISTLGGSIIMIWRLFYFLNRIENKLDKQDFVNFTSEYHTDLNKIRESNSNIRHELSDIAKEMARKVDDTKFQLLTKDIEILKKDMVTKTDFDEFKRVIIELLSDRNA